MRAIQFLGHNRIAFVDAPEPKPGPGEVVIEIRAAGICGSDLGYLYRPSLEEVVEEPSRYDQRNPTVSGVTPGHEAAGLIVEAGPGVHHLAVGDRVACYHISGCNECRACRAGWMLHCRASRAYGWQRDGAFAERMAADSKTCIKLPDTVSFAEGAYCACGAGTAYQATKRGAPAGGETVAIFGLGGVGLAGVVLARVAGARVIGIDPIGMRRDLALALGAAATIDPMLDDAVEAIFALTNGEGAHLTIDYSGSSAGRLAALDSARTWGRSVFVGERHPTTIDPSPQLLHKQLTLYGSWVCSWPVMDELVQLLDQQSISLEPAITHQLPFERIEEAFQIADQGASGKVVVTAGVTA
jgi:threonine dehydrogenase-like Zn-dependent dehydrogenase